MTRQELDPLVDETNLRAYLEAHLGPPAGGPRYAVQRHRAGHSNETFFVSWGAQELVLRRPPRGAFLPTAHDVLREHRFLAALHGTGPRVPRPVLACDDVSVIGAPFYLMERVAGEVIRLSLPDALDNDADRRRIGEELVDALAELHAADWRAAGLVDVGKPHGYLERQINRWTGQLELTQPKTVQARDVPELRDARDWLATHVPESPASTVVHGDYKPDNVVFAPGSPARLSAILDWEMATLGDPFADVGWMLSFWHDPEEGAAEDLLAGMQGVTAAPGFLTRREMLSLYEKRTGRGVKDLTFYLVLAHWKLAILLEGSYARHLTGKTDDPFFELMGEGVPAIARRAMRLAGKVFR